MEEENTLSAQLMRFFEQLKIYFDLRVDYLKLHVAEYLIKFMSSFALSLILFLISFFAVFFSSFAFAYWFGERTGQWPLGFLIVAGFYFLLALFFFVFRKAFIVRPFTRLILNQMKFDQINEKEHEKE
jgi:hypothetical protein